MVTKERHAPQAGQAAARPGPAQDPAWAGGAPEPAQAGRAAGPAWRARLEAQWRARLQAVTELSLAYHEAASVTATAPAGQPADRKARRLLRRATAARRALADTEEALGRLASGRYGRCEGCGALIPVRLLAAVPDARYCPHCRARPGRAARAGPAMAGRPALGGG